MGGSVRFVSQTQSPMGYAGAYGTLSNTVLQGNPLSGLGDVFAGCQFGPEVNLAQIQAFQVRLSDPLSSAPIVELLSEPESISTLSGNVDAIKPSLVGITDIGTVLEIIEQKLFAENPQNPSLIKLQLILPKPGTDPAILAVSHDRTKSLGEAKKALKKAATIKLQAPEVKKQPAPIATTGDTKEAGPTLVPRAQESDEGTPNAAERQAGPEVRLPEVVASDTGPHPVTGGERKAVTEPKAGTVDTGHTASQADPARVEEVSARAQLFRGQIVRFYISIPDGTKKLFMLEPGKSITVGSGMANDIQIEDEKVSQKHLRIYNNDGLLVVEDITGSTGTNVGEVTLYTSTILATTEIKLGGTKVITIDPIEQTKTLLTVGVKIYKKDDDGQIDQSKPMSTIALGLNQGEVLSIVKGSGSVMVLEGESSPGAHCVLTNKDGSLRIEDKSTEGTFNAGMERLAQNTSILLDLTPGYFWIGDYLVEVNIEKIEDPNATVSPPATSDAHSQPTEESAPAASVNADDGEGFIDEGPIASSRSVGPKVTLSAEGSVDLPLDDGQSEVVASGSFVLPLDVVTSDQPARDEVDETAQALAGALAAHEETMREQVVIPGSAQPVVAGNPQQAGEEVEVDETAQAIAGALAAHEETMRENGIVPGSAQPAKDTVTVDESPATIATAGVSQADERKPGEEPDKRGSTQPEQVPAKEDAPEVTVKVKTTTTPTNPIIRLFKGIINFFVNLYNKLFGKDAAPSKKGSDSGPSGQGPSEWGPPGNSGSNTSGGQQATGKTDKEQGILTMENAGIEEIPEGTVTYSLDDTIQKIEEARKPYRALFDSIARFNQENGADNIDETTDDESESSLSDSLSFLSLLEINGSLEHNIFGDDAIETAIKKALKDDIVKIYYELQKTKEVLGILRSNAERFLASPRSDDESFIDIIDKSGEEALLSLRTSRESFQELHSALKSYRAHKNPDTKATPPLLPDRQFVKKALEYSENDIDVAVSKATLSDLGGINFELAKMEDILQEEIAIALGVPALPDDALIEEEVSLSSDLLEDDVALPSDAPKADPDYVPSLDELAALSASRSPSVSPVGSPLIIDTWPDQKPGESEVAASLRGIREMNRTETQVAIDEAVALHHQTMEEQGIVPPASAKDKDPDVARLTSELEAARRELEEVRTANSRLEQEMRELKALRETNDALAQALIALRKEGQKASRLLGGAASAVRRKNDAIEELERSLVTLLQIIKRLGEDETSEEAVAGVSPPEN